MNMMHDSLKVNLNNLKHYYPLRFNYVVIMFNNELSVGNEFLQLLVAAD